MIYSTPRQGHNSRGQTSRGLPPTEITVYRRLRSTDPGYRFLTEAFFVRLIRSPSKYSMWVSNYEQLKSQTMR
jgi:hypothetical protein